MAATRDQLLDDALGFLNRRPTATTSEIAAAIGVSRATLHRHFASRDALIVEIGERATDRWERTQSDAGMEAATASGDPAALEAALREMLRRFVADAHDFAVVLTDEFVLDHPEIHARSERLLEREVAFYAAAQEAGVLRRDLPARWIADVVYGLMVAARDARRQGDVAERDLPDHVLTTFLRGAGR
jgi:AcrR family transcriptional regulator